MLVIVIAMVLIVVLAALVIAFAAYPHRGQEVPQAPWLGEAISRAADSIPTLDPHDERRTTSRR